MGSELANEQIVREFMKSWGVSFEASAAGLRSHCDPELVWRNSGLPDCNGVEAAVGLLSHFREAAGVETIVADVQNLASDGNVVISERLDYLVNAKGDTIGEVSVAGVMELRDGKIIRWHDYFDPTPLGALLGS